MAQRAGVSFELEALDLEDDRLVVTGHWSGVRGLRFVRPMLVADDRRILATLEHKPWAPSVDRAWVAAFPWEAAKLDVDTLTLTVAPQVTVALIGAPLDEPPPDPTRAPAPVAPLPAPEPLRDEPAPEPELPPAAAAPARPKRTRRVATLEAELEAVTRERDEARRDLEHALAQRDDAAAERDALVRTRARIELEHAEALQARAGAEAALAVAQEQRDEAAAQRDDLLLAYRELQVEAEAERAPAAPAPGGEAGPAVALGPRTMATARTAMAQMQRTAAPASRLPFSMLDLWVMRALGTVAAACCVLLLVSLLRVLI
jgi:hypothetical protein